MTIGNQLRLASWARPLIYPGATTQRLLIVGDSHASYINGVSGERYIYGIPRTWPCVFKGFYAPAGSWCNTGTNSGAISLLTVGATQHPTDGCVAPQDVLRYAPGAAVATDTLIARRIWDPAAGTGLAAFKQGSTTGNPFLNKAMVHRLGYWRRADSLTTGRSRIILSDLGTVPVDTSNVNYAGATGLVSRDESFSTSAGLGPGWDLLTGSEDETAKELTLIGHRMELADPSGGVSIASIGNGGQTAAAYAHATTICTDARWTDWLTMWGPFDRIMFVLGTNMTAGESADIPGVWAANMASFTDRLMDLNGALGGRSSSAMGLVITGHDANITSRYAGIKAACAAVAAADPRLAYYDSWADLPPYATLNATYLNDGVHFNADGALLASQNIADAMVQALGSSGPRRAGRASRVNRIARA